MANLDKIGLFPLGLVLFPEAVYPLHIFEDRYKQLINYCILRKNNFGINLISSSKLNNIGCTAEISDVIKKYPDGKLDILAVGVKRYKVIDFTEGDTPYFLANIEYFDDTEEYFDNLLLIEDIDLFNKIADNLKNVKIEKIKMASLMDTKRPSFFLAQKCGMGLDQKQVLLESTSENFRLTYIHDHLRRLLPIVHEAETVSSIIKNDGYYKPSFFK